MIDLTIARSAEIVGGSLADISPRTPTAARHRDREFDSRPSGRAGCSCVAAPLRRDDHAPSAVAAGAVAVLAARPRRRARIVVTQAAASTSLGGRPACSSTMPTDRARRCWPRWPTGRGGGRRTGGGRADHRRDHRSSASLPPKDLVAAVLRPSTKCDTVLRPCRLALYQQREAVSPNGVYPPHRENPTI